MKRRLVPAVTAATVTVLLLVVVNASGSGGSPSSDTTIRVVQKQTSIHFAGKLITITDDLFSHGRKIGRDQIACVGTGPGTFYECYASSLLPKGQIDGQGAIDPITTHRFTVAIVGGTGAYRTARGTTDNVDVSSTETDNIFHIIG
jgi:hypothetical protein